MDIQFYDQAGLPIDIAEFEALWRIADYRIIDKTAVADDVEVSTVWLGIDHGWHRDGPPVIFETMVFGGELDGDMWRYSTRQEAVDGHANAVTLARTALDVGHRHG